MYEMRKTIETLLGKYIGYAYIVKIIQNTIYRIFINDMDIFLLYY